MKNWIRFGVLFMGAALVVAPSFAAGEVTVGQFLVEIAKVKNLAASDSISAEGALRASGAALPAIDHGKTLTEGDVAAISSSVGLRVTTRTPGAAFTRSQVDAYLVSFGKELGSQDSSTRSADNLPPSASKGKGKKKGHFKSPTDPV